jgi:hypothetical protein
MKTGFPTKTRNREKPGYLGDEKIRLLRVDLFALETRFLWVLSVWLFVYQGGETRFLRSRNPVFPSLSMMIAKY